MVGIKQDIVFTNFCPDDMSIPIFSNIQFIGKIGLISDTLDCTFDSDRVTKMSRTCYKLVFDRMPFFLLMTQIVSD